MDLFVLPGNPAIYPLYKDFFLKIGTINPKINIMYFNYLGQSEKNPRYTLKEIVDNLTNRVSNLLKLRNTPPFFLTHSLGSLVLLNLIEQGHKVNKSCFLFPFFETSQTSLLITELYNLIPAKYWKKFISWSLNNEVMRNIIFELGRDELSEQSKETLLHFFFNDLESEYYTHSLNSYKDYLDTQRSFIDKRDYLKKRNDLYIFTSNDPWCSNYMMTKIPSSNRILYDPSLSHYFSLYENQKIKLAHIIANFFKEDF